MDDADTSTTTKRKGIGGALLIGLVALIGAGSLSGILAVASGMISGTLISYAVYTACGGKGERSCPCSWPGDDDAPTPCEAPTPSASVEPSPESTRWQERTATPTAARGR